MYIKILLLVHIHIHLHLLISSIQRSTQLKDGDPCDCTASVWRSCNSFSLTNAISNITNITVGQRHVNWSWSSCGYLIHWYPLISTFFFAWQKSHALIICHFYWRMEKGPHTKNHNCRHTWTSLRFGHVLSAATHASTRRWHIQALPYDLQLFWFKSVVSSSLFQGHPVFF